MDDGTIRLPDVLERIHAEVFRVLGRNRSEEARQYLMEFQDYIEKESELGRTKLVRKPDVVKDEAKLQKKEGRKDHMLI